MTDNSDLALTDLHLRPWTPELDGERIALLYRASVMQLARPEYSLEQRRKWASWADNGLLVGHLLNQGLTLVAESGSQLAGFAQLNPDHYVKMLYVAPDFARRGIARALLRQLEDEARTRHADKLRTHASKTSRPLFLMAGFQELKPAPTHRDGVTLMRYLMEKPLTATAEKRV